MCNDILFKIEMGLCVSNLLEVRSQILHHSERVTEYIEGFSRYLKLSKTISKRLTEFGSCHDIGKYGVPHSILTKPSKLNIDEYEIMKMHSIYGSQYVEWFTDLAYLAPYIRNHHERWDGSGYPDRLKRLEIPFECRVLAIIDAFDAMTGSRCYRDSISVEDALIEIMQGSGSQFDPKLTTHFICFISKYNHRILKHASYSYAK